VLKLHDVGEGEDELGADFTSVYLPIPFPLPEESYILISATISLLCKTYTEGITFLMQPSHRIYLQISCHLQMPHYGGDSNKCAIKNNFSNSIVGQKKRESVGSMR
jgi:hypothetical protein